MYRSSLPGVKRPERDVDHAPPSSAQATNEWSYTSAPPICLHGVVRDIFTFTIEYYICTVASLSEMLNMPDTDSLASVVD
jgi:hypothetical protein